MYIHFGREVHEALAQAIAAEEILGDRRKAEAKLAFAAAFVSRFHSGFFPDYGTVVLPADFKHRPELVEVLANFTGGLPVIFSEECISPEIINRVNVSYNRK